MDQPTKFPLAWPVNWPRTTWRKRGPFRRTFTGALDDLRREIRLLGASGLVISTNMPLRADGQPYAHRCRIDDPGAAVYFRLNDAPCVLACDRWLDLDQNIAAIAEHVNALRGQQRWGVGTLEQAFAGYAALPASTSASWRDVLRFGHEKVSLDQVKERFRSAVKLCHPDLGGNADAMVALNVAMAAAETELGAAR